jgi:hypothetical protein
MRSEAQKLLRELNWLTQAQRYLRSARSELTRNPNDRQLAAVIALMEDVVKAEQARLKIA